MVQISGLFDGVNDCSVLFDKLCAEVRTCRLCPRMNNSTRVLSRAAGPLGAKIMFIGEAPGRLGADETGIPFHGDKAGHNFDELIGFVGIDRNEIFVTNAVLCNPKDEKGNNAPPSRTEIANCSNHLRQQIELVNPRMVVTLGGAGLRAAALVHWHGLSLREHVRTANKWFGRLLIPVYHPGQRAMIHRSFANQRSDYQFIAERLRRLDRAPRKVKGNLKADVLAVVEEIIRLKPELSYFALHKLFYLVEYRAVRNLGRRLTSAYIVRQKDGPYCTDLHLTKLKNTFADLEVRHANGRLVLARKSLDIFAAPKGSIRELDDVAREIISKVLENYGMDDEARLKQRVYLTGPLRWMLKAEKRGINLVNAPIDFTKQSKSPLY